MEVRLSDHSASVGESVIVEVLNYGKASDTTILGVQILEVGPADFNSMMTTGLSAVLRNEKVQAPLNLNDFFKPGAVYEVELLNPSGQEEPFETLMGGRDFPRTFLRCKAAADEPPVSAEEAVEEAVEEALR